MFEWLDKKSVKSDKGYIWKRQHRFYSFYIENDHVLKVFVEGTFDKEDNYSLLVNSNFNKTWESPFNRERILEDKIKEIKQNIIEALIFMNINYEFTKL
ncbi:MAG: hypothetical protein JW982_04170 [Spirochaetes bacterium]|nr:hypothetical protein [Spirochaetota bacterium]